MLSLDERYGSIVLREYCTYDRPSYTDICSYEEIGVTSMDALSFVLSSDYHSPTFKKLSKINLHFERFDIFSKNLINFIKIILADQEEAYIKLGHNSLTIYGTLEYVTYIQLQRE